MFLCVISIENNQIISGNILTVSNILSRGNFITQRNLLHNLVILTASTLFRGVPHLLQNVNKNCHLYLSA